MVSEQDIVTIATVDGLEARLDMDAIAGLRRRLHGALLLRGDEGYDRARMVWNGMIDRRPALIARPADADDVAALVAFSGRHRLRTTVRGGGHNVAGSAVCDDGLVIDLAAMRAVTVDPVARNARVQAGATIGDVDRATQPHGLALPAGVVSETGIAGLTLGGGYGHLRRAYGLTCDNLLAAEIITGDGQARTASAAENADLFWALRGGGAAPGVVTAFEFRLHPVGPEVMTALVIYPFDSARAVLRGFREYTAQAPDEVSVLMTCAPVPESPDIPEAYHGQPSVIFVACYAGPPEAGARALQPLRALGAPLADLSGPMPYLDLQLAFDADYPAHALRYYWTSLYLNDLSDDAIERLIALTAARPAWRSTVDLWHLGGAIDRAEDGAFANRGAPFLLGVEANWERAEDDGVNIGWARSGIEALRPFATGGRYLNFPGFFEGGSEGMRALHGGAYERLAAIKRRYDPLNLFGTRAASLV